MEINPVYDYKEWMENMKGDLSVKSLSPSWNTEKIGFDLSEEEDPTGIGAHDPGAKLDAGKVMASLLLDFNKALLAVAEVGTIGAKKYSRGGWKEVPDGYNRYTDAMLRHLFADSDYDDGVGGTGLLHDAQVAWNALARLQYRLEGKLE